MGTVRIDHSSKVLLVHSGEAEAITELLLGFSHNPEELVEVNASKHLGLNEATVQALVGAWDDSELFGDAEPALLFLGKSAEALDLFLRVVSGREKLLGEFAALKHDWQRQTIAGMWAEARLR